MHVLHGYHHVPLHARGAVLAIGNFDGVHAGHQALIQTARAEAARHSDARAGVMIFEPHPRRFFQPDTPHFQLTPLALKLDLLARYGVDMAVILPFDAAFSSLTADAYIEQVLVAGLGIRHVMVGYDFHFGKGRSGGPAILAAAGRALGFDVTIIDPVKTGTTVASSSAIRAALTSGDVAGAAAMLGHWWRVCGTVTGGAKRGTGMGYPTANMALPSGTTLGHGIYAARVYVGDDVHAGAAYLGTRPTFDDGTAVLETFLLDFDGDLYGQTIAVEFIARLRGDAKFADMPDLVAQMDRDVASARVHLAPLAVSDPHVWPRRPPPSPRVADA
jgi:riboflavin kinase / FMN adenylyltransferase